MTSLTMSDFSLPFQIELSDAVKSGLEETEHGGNSVGILTLGESGSGKTYANDMLANCWESYTDGAQLISPCLRLNVSAIGGTDSIPSAALAQLGRPVRTKIPNIELVLIDALIKHRVRLILLEEFHNRLLSSKKEFRHSQGEFLKNLWNFVAPQATRGWATPVSGNSPRKPVIVISGLPKLLDAFESDSELGSRFPIRIFANRLGMFPESDFKDFRKIVKEMSLRFAFDELVNPNDSNFVSRCFLASSRRAGNGRLECHLRELEVIFQRAATLRRRMKTSTEITPLFEKAFQQVGSATGRSGNPFSLASEEFRKLVIDEQKRFDATSSR
jgi:hypothetical protein